MQEEEVSCTPAKSLSVTVPVFDEEQNVPILYERLAEVLETVGIPWEIIFVNDGSHDGSAAALDELATKDVRVRVVHFRRNFGQTAAMMAGVDFASGDVIIPIDADLQNDPRDIPGLLAKLDEGYDVVSGWRRDRKDHRLRRNMLSRVANRLISFISGVKLHDYGCTLKAYRREVIKDVRLYGEMHRFIPIYASWLGAKITEIPVTHHPRVHGKSKYGIERVIKVVFDLVVVKFLARYSEKPMYVFGTAGALSLFISFASGVWALYLKVVDGVSFIQTPLPLLVVMTGITGVMCFLMGLTAELVMRTYFESQSKATYLVSRVENLNSKVAAQRTNGIGSLL
jgi:glycosyltransferase involved in cell wall biosynthesis